MSTRQTTVGELTAADLGKWVEFAGESGHLTMVSHHHSSVTNHDHLHEDAEPVVTVTTEVLDDTAWAVTE